MNDNTILRIKVPAHLYESVKEQLTLTEAKNKPHYGAGMEVVKEKKMKTTKDGMKKMEEAPKDEVKEEAKVAGVPVHTQVKTVADLAKMMRKIALQLGLMKGIQPTEIMAIGELLQSILDKVQTGDITTASVKADRAFDTATQNIKPAQNEAKKKDKSEEEEEAE